MNQSFYVGALGAGNCTEKLSVISNNLANVNTNGFKPKTTVFSQLINYNLNDSEGAVTELQAGAGMKVQRTYTGFDTSGLTQTGSPMDYAILEPNAFFMVQDPATGAVSYTRDGHFHLSVLHSVLCCSHWTRRTSDIQGTLPGIPSHCPRPALTNTCR